MPAAYWLLHGAACPLPAQCSMCAPCNATMRTTQHALWPQGVLHYLVLFTLPLWWSVERLWFMATAPAPLPDFAPPAAPPPPSPPDVVGAAATAVFAFAEVHPIYYLLIDFATAFAIGLLVLYMKDINEWIEAQRAAARAAASTTRYQPLKEEAEQDIEGGSASVSGLGPAIVDFGEDASQPASGKSKSMAELSAELRLVNDKIEELEIKT